jgi:hypothetical protein
LAMAASATQNTDSVPEPTEFIGTRAGSRE